MKEKKLNSIGRKFYDNTGYIMYQPNGNLRLQLLYTNETGKHCKKSFIAPTLTECYNRANLFAKKKLGLLANGDSTIPEIIEAKSRSDREMNYITNQTYYANLGRAKQISKHVIGQIPVKMVTMEILFDYLSTLSEYSDSTIEFSYRVLFNAFEIAAQEQIIKKNPMKSYEVRRPKSNKGRKKVNALTEEEQALVVNDIITTKVPFGSMSYKLQYLIQLYSGLRMGEVNALKPEDIDFKSNVIHVRNTVITYNSTVMLSNTTKTYSGIRDVPISKNLKPVLEASLKQMKENPSGTIFYDYKRACVISTTKASAAFRSICKRCKIEVRGSHALRHTFATRCIEAGVPAVVLKTWLGHTDIHVTLDTYADVFERMNNNAVNKLDEHLSKLLPED